MACDHLVRVSFTPRAGCQIPRYLLPAPLLITYAPYIISFLFFLLALLGPNSNLQLFTPLKPYCQHSYPQYTTIPVVWAEVFRNTGWVGEGDALRLTEASLPGVLSQSTHCCWAAFFPFLPLFGVDFHLELKTHHSLLFVCYCQVRPSTQEEGGITYVHRIFLAV